MFGYKYWITILLAVTCSSRVLAKVTTYKESCRYNNYTATYTLEDGPKSAVVIHFAEVTKHLNRTIRCTIKFEGSRKPGYGVVGVLESIFMRRVKDDFHRWGESRCIDYVKEYPAGRSASGYDICGFRKRKHGYDSLESFDYSQGIVGACLGVLGCDTIQTITLEIVIGDLKALQISKEAGSAIIEHADIVGFTLLVTAYKLPKYTGNDRRSLCEENEFLCSNVWPAPVMNPFCIWDGFECDGHPNCGLSGALDEDRCLGPPIRFTGRNLEQMFVIVLFLLIVSCLTCVIVRWRRQLEGAIFFNPNSRTDIERNSTYGGQEMACQSAQTISLLVLYQQNNVEHAPADPPPYSSLFGRVPPSYSSLNFGSCPSPSVGRDEADGPLPD